MFPLGPWNLFTECWFIKNSHIVKKNSVCLEIQWTPYFMGKLFFLIIKKNLFFLGCLHFHQQSVLSKTIQVTEKKVSGIEIRSRYTICFYKPILHFKMSCRGINFSIFSSQSWNWSFFFFFQKRYESFQGVSFKHWEHQIQTWGILARIS